jgi:hypothetical protein
MERVLSSPLSTSSHASLCASLDSSSGNPVGEPTTTEVDEFPFRVGQSASGQIPPVVREEVSSFSRKCRVAKCQRGKCFRAVAQGHSDQVER